YRNGVFLPDFIRPHTINPSTPCTVSNSRQPPVHFAPAQIESACSEALVQAILVMASENPEVQTAITIPSSELVHTRRLTKDLFEHSRVRVKPRLDDQP